MKLWRKLEGSQQPEVGFRGADFQVGIRNGVKRFLDRSRDAGKKRELAVVAALLFVLGFVHENEWWSTPRDYMPLLL
jgi:hypothetical protein